MNLETFFKISKDNLSFKKISQKAGNFWLNHQVSFFIFFIFLAAIAGGYYWYKFQFSSGWNEEQKKEYLVTQSKEINLKEDEFRKILDDIAERKKILESEHWPVRDIFKPY